MINSEILFLLHSIFFGDYNDAVVTTFKLKHDFFFSTNGDKAFEDVSLKDNPKK